MNSGQPTTSRPTTSATASTTSATCSLLPPLLMEKYLDAAEAIADQAIITGDEARGPTRRFKAEAIAKPGSGQTDGDSGFWLMSTNDEVGDRPRLPESGLLCLPGQGLRPAGGQGPAQARIPRQRQARPELRRQGRGRCTPAVFEAKVKIKHADRFAVAFTNDAYYPDFPDPKKRDRNLAVEWIEVVGPIFSLPNDLPDSHRKIIFRRPNHLNRREVAREVLQKFATRAFRRPATAPEVERLASLVDLALKNGDTFEKGIQLAMQAVLVSPHFLFRVELDTRPVRYARLPNDLELASRLSYFLWSSMPDDELLDLAARGNFGPARTSTQQVRRMLRDPKSKALADNFAGQWLQTRNLKLASPDRGRFPSFDEPLRAAMLRGDRAVLRRDRQGRPDDPRLPRRRLHLPQRAAGQALRDQGRDRRPVPPGRPGR